MRPRVLASAIFGLSLGLTGCSDDGTASGDSDSQSGTSAGTQGSATSAGSQTPAGTDSSDSTPTSSGNTEGTSASTTGSTTASTTDGTAGSDSTSDSASSGDTEGSGSTGDVDYGAYGDCANEPTATACLPGSICLNNAVVDPLWGVCADQGCSTAADCPDAPPGGDAPVACVEFDFAGVNECILDCSGNAACPPGMACLLNQLCAHESGGDGYGDCLNNAPEDVCRPDELCLLDNQGNPSAGVCFKTPCVVPNDCPDAPATGNAPVDCIDVNQNVVGDCVLRCDDGETCPNGMSCFDNDYCAWM